MSTILRPVGAGTPALEKGEADARRAAGHGAPMGIAGVMKAAALEAMHCAERGA